ncbi:MAG TPA: hypothetical protein VF468_30140 [Actinomycetota bacterium]|nr:hypothetical protein [Actinomycetota bacterium]
MAHQDHNAQQGGGSGRGRGAGSTPGPRPASRPGPPPDSGTFHFSNRTNWTLLRVAAVLGAGGRRVLAAATGEAGRRVARAVAVTVVLAVLVAALYDRGEVPVAAAGPAVAGPAGATNGPAARARGGTARRADPGSLGGLRGRDRPAPVGERPAAVAAAWYAARQGVPRAKVKPLQQDRLSSREVRVLVLADHGRGRLRTALVRVRLGRDGWSVR